MQQLRRVSSSPSLKLLDPDLTDQDVFDPPTRLPGRFLQFTDISLEDSHHGHHGHQGHSSQLQSSCSREERGDLTLNHHQQQHHQEEEAAGREELAAALLTHTSPSSCVVHIRSTGSLSRLRRHRLLLPWPRSKVAMIVTSCMTFTFTALTFLTFIW